MLFSSVSFLVFAGMVYVWFWMCKWRVENDLKYSTPVEIPCVQNEVVRKEEKNNWPDFLGSPITVNVVASRKSIVVPRPPAESAHPRTICRKSPILIVPDPGRTVSSVGPLPPAARVCGTSVSPYLPNFCASVRERSTIIIQENSPTQCSWDNRRDSTRPLACGTARGHVHRTFHVKIRGFSQQRRHRSVRFVFGKGNANRSPLKSVSCYKMFWELRLRELSSFFTLNVFVEVCRASRSCCAKN